MDARSFREELERQNAQFEAAMKTLESLGNVGISIPDETLRAIDEACTPRAVVSTVNCTPFEGKCHEHRFSMVNSRKRFRKRGSSYHDRGFDGDGGMRVSHARRADGLLPERVCKVSIRRCNEAFATARNNANAGSRTDPCPKSPRRDPSQWRSRHDVLGNAAASRSRTHRNAIKDAIEQRLTHSAARKASKLQDIGDNLTASSTSATRSRGRSDFQNTVVDACERCPKDLNSLARADSMINLQSLMSQRQQAIQMCTNLVQSLGDQCNKIAENIGH